jgi:hypothetical protein
MKVNVLGKLNYTHTQIFSILKSQVNLFGWIFQSFPFGLTWRDLWRLNSLGREGGRKKTDIMSKMKKKKTKQLF